MVEARTVRRRERRLARPRFLILVSLPLRLTRRASPDPPTRRPSLRTSQLDKRGASVDAKIKQLDAELARHREILRTCRTPAAKEAAKRRALQVLKQRRLYEGQREQLYNQQFNVEQISFAAQSAKDTAAQVSAMQASAKELKAQFKSKAFDVDKIDALNDEMADLMDQSKEIQDVLGSYDVPEDIDEEEPRASSTRLRR